jgi:Fe(3+) dicitrate transport protein
MATPWLATFAGVHRGYSPVIPGQPEAVKPEFAVNYELGARAIWRGLHAEVVGFASDYDNLIGVCTFSSGCVDGDGTDQYEAGAALVWGAEMLASWKQQLRSGFRYEVGARYTYTGSRFRDDFDSAFPQWGMVEKGFRLPYVPEHLVGGTVAVGGRIWEISAAPSYSGEMRDVAGEGDIPDTERIPGFFVLDLSAEVRVLKRFRIYTQIANATNSAYIASLRPFGARPGAPLTFVLGVKANIM